MFGFYNDLFDYLDNSIAKPQRKRALCKQLMVTALESSKEELQSYYKESRGLKVIFSGSELFVPQIRSSPTFLHLYVTVNGVKNIIIA